MKKSILLPALFVLSSIFIVNLQGQDLEYGAKAGVSYYFGDLAPSSHIFSFSTPSPSGGIFIKRQINDYFALRGDVSYLFLKADDANGTAAWRANRNLDFASHVFEGSITMEFIPFELRLGRNNNIHPYLGIGLGVFHFDPYTIYNGSEIKLNPLNTEGQGLDGYGDPYALTQINIPMRLGIQFSLSYGLNIGLEVSYRDLFTDYLDDVSGYYVPNTLLAEAYGPLSAILSDKSPGMVNSTDTGSGLSSLRGAPQTEDGYGDLVLTISYTISRTHIGSGFSRNKVSCPTF